MIFHKVTAWFSTPAFVNAALMMLFCSSFVPHSKGADLTSRELKRQCGYLNRRLQDNFFIYAREIVPIVTRVSQQQEVDLHRWYEHGLTAQERINLRSGILEYTRIASFGDTHVVDSRSTLANRLSTEQMQSMRQILIKLVNLTENFGHSDVSRDLGLEIAQGDFLINGQSFWGCDDATQQNGTCANSHSTNIAQIRSYATATDPDCRMREQTGDFGQAEGASPTLSNHVLLVEQKSIAEKRLLMGLCNERTDISSLAIPARVLVRVLEDLPNNVGPGLRVCTFLDLSTGTIANPGYPQKIRTPFIHDNSDYKYFFDGVFDNYNSHLFSEHFRMPLFVSAYLSEVYPEANGGDDVFYVAFGEACRRYYLTGDLVRLPENEEEGSESPQTNYIIEEGTESEASLLNFLNRVLHERGVRVPTLETILSQHYFTGRSSYSDAEACLR